MALNKNRPDFLIKEVEDTYAQENWYRLKLFLENFQRDLNPIISNNSQIVQSSSFTEKLGWTFIQDTQHTSATPLVLPAGVRTLVTNDNAGFLSSISYGNNEASTWWNSSTNTFEPSREGDFYILRFSAQVETTVNNETLIFEVDIGTGISPFSDDFQINRGAGTPTQLAEVIPLGTASAPAANGFKFYITAAVDMELYDLNILAQRTFSP